MRAEIVRADPQGNNTLLVISPVPTERRLELSKKLLAFDGSWAEQVGFVSDKIGFDAELSMMGGEFCGNASLSVAALLAERRSLDRLSARLSVSGCEEPVICDVAFENGGWCGSVTMPLPISLAPSDCLVLGKKLSLFTVRFPGITHAIADAELFRGSDVAEQAKKLGKASGDAAFGLILYDRKLGGITPYIYVAATESCVPERSCASGSAAVGCMLAIEEGGCSNVALRQPGGSIFVSAAVLNGAITALSISGSVRLFPAETVEIQA